MADDKIITPPDAKFKDKLKYNKLLDHAKVMAKSMVIDEIAKQNTQNRYMNSLKETGKYPNLNIGDNVRFNNPKYNNYGTKTKVKELSFEGVHPDTLKRMQKRGTAKDLIKMKGEYYRPLIVFEDGSRVDATDLKEQKVVRTISAKSSTKPLPIMDISSKEFREAEKNIEQKRAVTSPTPVHKLHSIKGANFPGGKVLKRFNKGGTAMKQQMEMFEDGGLKDEGGMTDEVSGNDVPSGSTREEVRDDIPAQLSEGEFVFPADVVRFLGLEKLMQMRQKAKMGLQKMEDMGQMGNSDEATMPDDMPFDLNDLDMQEDVDNEEDVEYNKGGVVKAAVGAFMNKPYNYDEQINPVTGLKVNSVEPYMPARNILGASDPSKLVGGVPVAEADSEMFEQRRYVNEATGQVRSVSFNKATGQTSTNIKQLLDQGFIRKDEPIKEAAKTATPTSTNRRPQESQDNNDNNDGVDAALGGGRVDIGGITYAVQYNFDGTVGLANVDKSKASGTVNFSKVTAEVAGMIKDQAIGQVAELAKGMTTTGIATTAMNELSNKLGITIPGVNKAEVAIAKSKDIRRTFKDRTNLRDIFETGKDALDTLSKEKGLVRTGKDFRYSSVLPDLKVPGSEGMTEDNIRDIQAGLETGSNEATGITTTDGGLSTNYSDNNINTGGDGPSDGSNEATGATGDSSAGLDDFNKGGLAGKKKTRKTKKMKRGGLASR